MDMAPCGGRDGRRPGRRHYTHRGRAASVDPAPGGFFSVLPRTRAPGRGGGGGDSVVIAALDDVQRVIADFVDETMFVINPACPAASQIALQRLGLADSGEWGTQRVANEVVQSLEPLRLPALPSHVLLPSILGERQLHTSIPSSRGSTILTLPARVSAIECRRRRAFSGLESRYVVSSPSSPLPKGTSPFSTADGETGSTRVYDIPSFGVGGSGVPRTTVRSAPRSPRGPIC